MKFGQALLSIAVLGLFGAGASILSSRASLVDAETASAESSVLISQTDLSSLVNALKSVTAYLGTQQKSTPVSLPTSAPANYASFRSEIDQEIKAYVTRQSDADSGRHGTDLTNITESGTFTNPTISGASIIDSVLSSGISIPSFAGQVMTTGSPGFSITRQEATPTAPTAVLQTDGTGNCTAGTHVFAVVFNTVVGHTDVSPVSSVVTCDGTHTKVTVTIPESKMYVVTRDIYASKANTTSPLYLISASPVVSFAVANPDQADSNAYTFNIADSSFTATVAPTTNTAIDPAYSFGADGQTSFGSGASLHSLSSNVAWQVIESGSVNTGIFQRLDPGEARLTIVNGGVNSPSKFNYPELVLINPGITVGANSAVSYTPMVANTVIAALNVRGTYTTGGSFSCSGCVGFDWLTTEDWSAAGNGTLLKVRLMKTGLPVSAGYVPLAIDSVNGSVFTGGGATSASYAIKATDSNSASLFVVRDDGRVGVGTSSPTRMFDVAGSVGFPGIANGAGTAYVCQTLATGVISTSTSACNPSSLRFKDNIETLSDARGLDIVNQLRPVTYVYKPELLVPGNQIGFIAEEVAPLVPEIVGLDEEGRPSNIDYSKLTPILVKAIQELDAKVNATSTASSTQTVIDNSGLLDNLAFVGGTIVGNVVHFVELVVDHLRATLVSTENLEIKDSATGEWYCVRITNGEWDKQPGTCAEVSAGASQGNSKGGEATSTDPGA